MVREDVVGVAVWNAVERRLKMLENLLSTQVDTAVPSLASCPDDSSVIDLALSDEDTVEFSPSLPSFEVLDTDDCAKVRFPNDVSTEVLDAHLRHHLSDQGGISPIVRSWCIDKFCEIYPDAPCADFNFI